MIWQFSSLRQLKYYLELFCFIFCYLFFIFDILFLPCLSPCVPKRNINQTLKSGYLCKVLEEMSKLGIYCTMSQYLKHALDRQVLWMRLMVRTCFLVKIKCYSYGHCYSIHILSLESHKFSVKTNLTLTTPCLRSYTNLCFLNSEVGHFLSIHALHVGQIHWIGLFPRHFSFDLMIAWTTGCSALIQFGWCPVWLLPSQMIFSPIIHCMQIRNLSIDGSCTEQFIQRFFQLLFIKHLLGFGPQTLTHGLSASPLS